jgi:murein DD-endopeptidase MepM/ murein hydrolase activator NlpD
MTCGVTLHALFRPGGAARKVLATFTALCLVVLGSAQPATSQIADPVAAYQESNAALDELRTKREHTQATLAAATAAERVAQERLAATEAELRRWLGARAEAARVRADFPRRIAGIESEIEALGEERRRLDRRLAATEAWLTGSEAPRAPGMHGYWAAATAWGELGGAQGELEAQLAVERQEEAAAVGHLGRLNSEVTAWEQRADQFSRQLGLARTNALAASGALATMQRTGDTLAAEVRSQFEALRLAGHPIETARIAQGLVPILPPATWPSERPPQYVLPVGTGEASLRPAEPLLTTASDLTDSGALHDLPGWSPPVAGRVTTRYGGGTPYQPAHWAVDVGTRLYQPVVAAAGGTVEYAGLSARDNRLASYGAVVVVRHSPRVTTLYAHLDDRTHGLAVSAGDTVAQGQIVGYVGLTGYSTGPHLHFEVRIDNRPIDPLLLLRF